MQKHIDAAEINRTTDLLNLAGRYTELRRESHSEMSGPCPKCGGTDRFHVTADWFSCRQCHEKRGDAIGFVMWLHGLGFKEAARWLARPGAVEAAGPRRTPERKPAPAGLPAWAAARLETAQERLLTGDAGKPGRAYLAGRGLLEETWREFRFGFDPAVAIPGTQGQETAPAIALPWYDAAGALVAVRYRFLEAHNGRKLTAMPGSAFAGHLFGQHRLTPDPKLTLIICEGELNAASIWQVAQGTRVDVASLGSEAAHIPDDLAALVAPYRHVIAWLDKPEHAARVAREIPGAAAVKSLEGRDANDWLRETGRLGGFLAGLRLHVCKTEEDQLRLLYDLYDGGLTHIGLDRGAAGYVQKIGGQLGRPVQLREGDGRWFAAANER